MMKTGKIEFDGFTIEKIKYQPNVELPWQRNHFSKLSFVINGSLIEKTSEDELIIESPCMVIQPQNTLHETIFGNAETTIISLTFSNQLASLHPLSQVLKEWCWINGPKTATLGENIWTEIQKIKGNSELTKLLTNFIYEVYKLKSSAQHEQPFWLKEIVNLLNSNSGKDLPINKLASKVILHKAHLTRMFKKHFITDKRQYKNDMQLLYAISQLASSKESLASIAYNSGYSDQYAMKESFQQKLGITPTGFHNLLLNPASCN